MGYGMWDVGMWECGNARPDARDSKKDEVLKKTLCHSATLQLYERRSHHPHLQVAGLGLD